MEHHALVLGGGQAPTLDIREVQRTFVEYNLELVADAAVMQVLPPDLAMEAQKGSPILAAEKLCREYLHGPEPLRTALRAFVAHHQPKTIIESQASELCLFDDDMPAVSPRFVGRSDELRQIMDNLLSYEPRSVAIRGVYGIGKTTLARKVVADPRIEELYEIAWIPCAEIRTLVDLDKRLGLLRRARHPTSQNSIWQGRAIAVAPGSSGPLPEAAPKRLLIVLDRIDPLVEAHRRDFKLSDFLTKLEQHRVLTRPRLLITLDGSHDLGIVPINIELRPLHYEDAKAFFTSFEFTSRWREEQGLDNLVYRFAGHPLALAIAARAAPKHGNIETYLVLLERQTHPDEDELDVALRLLLFDSSLQHPKTKEILQLVAYWPHSGWGCPRDVVCSVLELPDAHTVSELADPASKLGLLRCTKDWSAFDSADLAYEMLGPFKDRLQRFWPLSDDQLSAVRRLVFGRSFRDPERGRTKDSVFHRFKGLGKVFEGAFESSDPDVVTSALDAVLSVPRCHFCWDGFDGSWNNLHMPTINHQLNRFTLEKACDGAGRLNDSHRLQLLGLLALENEVYRLRFHPADHHCSMTNLAADLRTALDSWSVQTSDIAGHAVHKCCYLLAVCSSRDARSAAPGERPSFLRQALQYLDTPDREPKFESAQDRPSYWFLMAPWETLVSRLQTEMLRIYLLMQLSESDRARDACYTILAALDDARAADLEVSHTESMVRLDVAAVFAVHGDLARAGEVVDLSIRGLPDGTSRQVVSNPPNRMSIAPLTLLRYHLARHQDALCWTKWCLPFLPRISNMWWSILYLLPIDEWLQFMTFSAESGVLKFNAAGETASLYEVWLWLLLYWNLSREEVNEEQLHSEILDEFRSPTVDGFPTPRLLSVLKELPSRSQITDYPASYRHSVAAIDALACSDFSKARLEFLMLQTTSADDLPHVEDDHLDLLWVDPEHLFPVAVRLSVWDAVFGALADDCLRRASQRPVLTQGSDTPVEGSPEEPTIIIGKQALQTYMQAITFVFVWILSCLPDLGRVVA